MSSVIADKVGRRPLLMYSFLGTSLSYLVVGVYFFCQEVLAIDKDVLAPYAIAVFVGLISSNIISTLGYHSIIYAIQGEIYPLNVKSVAMTTFNIMGGFLNFGITKAYQPLKDAAGLFSIFCVFIAISIMSVAFVHFAVPETKGKSLGEIQVILQGKYYDNTDDKFKIIITDTNGAQDSTELKPMIDKKS